MMELTLNKKNKDLIEILISQRSAVATDECEHFAYRKSLLFYTEDCAHCRYAKVMKDNSGKKDCVCTFAANNLKDA